MAKTQSKPLLSATEADTYLEFGGDQNDAKKKVFSIGLTSIRCPIKANVCLQLPYNLYKVIICHCCVYWLFCCQLVASKFTNKALITVFKIK